MPLPPLPFVLDPKSKCTCSLPADHPRKPPACVCKFKDRELWKDARIPKFTPEDVFYILCAVFWDPATSGDQWRDIILYHFVCEGDRDFIRARNLVSSLLGRFYKSEYNAQIMKLEPGQSWEIYDAKKFFRDSLVTRSNFIAFRGEASDSQSMTLVNPSDIDRTSVYDSELDFYTDVPGNEEDEPDEDDYDEHDEEDKEQYQEKYEHNDEDNGEEEQEEIELGPGRTARGICGTTSKFAGEPAPYSPLTLNDEYPESQQSFPRSQGISCKSCKECDGPPGPEQHHHDHKDHVPDLQRPRSRAVTTATTDSVANNAPAPAVVDMINSWVPTVSKFGGEVRISRFGSATIKFPDGRKNAFG
ncbi:hypothetical protein TWF281_006543 [Arthrobotrys megalospora]